MLPQASAQARETGKPHQGVASDDRRLFPTPNLRPASHRSQMRGYHGITRRVMCDKPR